jgi:MFS family permease
MFNWKKAVFVGFGFAAIFLIWPIYNQFIPIFLQIGNPQFETTTPIDSQSLTNIYGFGLSSTLAFFILTWDNIINIFVQSWVGARSDRTWTRWGRRKPWIVVGVPIAVLGFILIPYARTLIVFLMFILITNLGMAFFRAPTAALLGDLFPPEQRSKARGVTAIMAGLGGLVALVIGNFLFDRFGRPAPFIFSASLMVASIIIVLIFVQEPRKSKSELEVGKSTVRQTLRALWQTDRHRGIWLLLTIGLSFMAFESIQVGISSFAVFVLGLPLGQAGRLTAVFALALIIMAYPSGVIGTRLGRKRAISIGLIGLVVSTVLSYFFIQNVATLLMGLILLGSFSSMTLVNDLPFLYDVGNESHIGAYTGVYFVATQSASVLGATLAGISVDMAGSHRAIFAFGAVCALLAFLSLQRMGSVIPNQTTVLSLED